MAYISFQPSDYFNTILWSGNGSAGRNITGVGFQPDWVWVKNRSRSSNYTVVDVLRGNGSYPMSTSQTSAQDSGDTNQVSALISDGFTVGSSTNTNANGENLVGWNWKGGGTGSSNSDGSANNVLVSASTTSGVSIVQGDMNASGSWTFGHGLGVAPSVIILRGQAVTSHWFVYHKSLGEGTRVLLNSTDGSASDTTFMANTAPTNSVFSMNAGTWSAGAGEKIIAYCFAEKAGFSKFGSYKGNGSTWGPFINCGFKPAWVLWKRTDSANGWILMDNKRPTVNSVSYGSNPQNALVEPQSNGAEATSTSYHVNFLSNGFKMRNTNNVYNNTSGSYIYMAFADEPLVSSNSIAATGN